MRSVFFLFLFIIATLPLHARETTSAAEKKPAEPVEFTTLDEVVGTPGLADDFTIQGEYLAELNSLVNGKRVKTRKGMQIIADGGGKFRWVSLSGGLPGDGWDTRSHSTGRIVRKDAKTLEFTVEKVFDDEGKEVPSEYVEPKAYEETVSVLIPKKPARMPTIAADSTPEQIKKHLEMQEKLRPIVKLKVPAMGSVPSFTWEKTVRKSPTLGLKAPSDSFIVFDGTNLDNFEPGAKLNKTPYGNTLWSEAVAKPFERGRPYSLHLEFLLSYMPTKKGQQRSNSGVYIAECYECQILDSFGLYPQQNNECGGFYKIKAADINMCFPPLTWQTYDIDFTPAKFTDGRKTADARITIRQNGVLIHDDIELPKETPGRKKEADEARGLFLQGHGNKVQFRNIWLKYE